MRLAASLDYVYVSAGKASAASIEAAQIQVKGDNFILSTLQLVLPTIQHLSGRYLNLVPVANHINVWIAKLGTKYGDRVIWGGPPFHLDAADGSSLAGDSKGWLLELLNTYSDSVD
jgi:hypothetical protein